MNHKAINVLEDITPLSSFKVQASELIKNLCKKKRPTFITVNGKVEAVIQDANSYQQSMDRIEELETLLSIQKGLDDIEQGNVEDAEDVFKRIKARYENL